MPKYGKKQQSHYDPTELINFAGACEYSPPWDCMLRSDIFNETMAFASSVSSHADMVIISILAGLSIVSETCVELEPGHQVFLNTFIMVACLSGFGKTPAFRYCLAEPLSRLEKEKNIRLVLNDATLQGMNKFLQLNDGRGLMAHDELSVFFERLNTAEFASMKSVMNTMYSNQTYTKDLASGPPMVINDPYLCLFGMIQPKVMLTHLYDLIDDDCGFIQRVILLSVGAFTAPSTASFKDLMDHRPPTFVPDFIDSISLMYESVYTYFHEHDTERMKLSTDAITYMQGLKAFHSSNSRSGFATLVQMREQATTSQGAPVGQLPRLDLSSSKVVDNTVKIGSLLHILHGAWKAKTSAELRRSGVLDVIDEIYFTRGNQLIVAARNQMKVYVASRETSEERKAVRVRKPGISSPDQIQKKILMFPGAMVSVRMYRSFYRNDENDALAIKSAMDSLVPARGETGFVGTCQTRGRNTVFVKASPVQLTKEALEKHGLDFTKYAEEYTKDCPTLNHGFKVGEFARHMDLIRSFATPALSVRSAFSCTSHRTGKSSLCGVSKGQSRRRRVIDPDDGDEDEEIVNSATHSESVCAEQGGPWSPIRVWADHTTQRNDICQKDRNMNKSPVKKSAMENLVKVRLAKSKRLPKPQVSNPASRGIDFGPQVMYCTACGSTKHKSRTCNAKVTSTDTNEDGPVNQHVSQVTERNSAESDAPLRDNLDTIVSYIGPLRNKLYCINITATTSSDYAGNSKQIPGHGSDQQHGTNDLSTSVTDGGELSIDTYADNPILIDINDDDDLFDLMDEDEYQYIDDIVKQEIESDPEPDLSGI